jgi:hypothetical protein
MAIIYIDPKSPEGVALSEELDKVIEDSKRRLDKLGANSYEGVSIVNGELVTVDSDE